MKKFSIPSKFSIAEEKSLNNPNFHPVKLRIMSSGKNWNGSDFAIDSLALAKDTVSYSPILANVVEREDGELDANGHDVDMEIKMDYKGNVSFKETYVERAVGVFINDSSEVKYDEENDVNYLEAYGYIWKTYSDIYEILKRDEVKDVSVEIEVVQGAFREDGYYQIDKFNVLGCTILGNGMQPAIDNSRIEFNFSMDNNKEYLDNLEQVKELLKEFSKKEGRTVENEKEFAEEVCPECGKNPCECNKENEPKEEEFAEEVCPKCGKPIEECECEEDEEDMACGNKKKKKCSCEEDEEEYEEVHEEEEMACGNKKKKKCSCDEDHEEVHEEEKKYSQSEMDEAIANAKAEFSEVLVELAELREFKAQYEREEELKQLNKDMDELVAKFNVNEDKVNELKEKVVAGEYSLEKFELELYRNNEVKRDFSKEDKKSTALPVVDNEKKMSEVDALFARYGIIKK